MCGSVLRNNTCEGGQAAGLVREREAGLRGSWNRGHSRLHPKLWSWNGPLALFPRQARGKGDRPLYPTSDLVLEVGYPQKGT